LSNFVRHYLLAVQFFTRLPITGRLAGWVGYSPEMLRASAAHFPGVGWLVAAVAMGVHTLLWTALAGSSGAALVAAVFSTAATVWLTGGLHEDGLADVADGLFGGQDKARRLEIMKDSRIGTYGAITLAFALAIRTITIAAILQAGLLAAALSLLGSQALARSAMVWHWTNLPPAKSDGVAANSGQPDEASTHFALASGIGIALAAALFARGAIPALIGLALAAGATYVFRQLCNRKIAGYTGDTLGASAVLAELAFLTGLASGL